VTVLYLHGLVADVHASYAPTDAVPLIEALRVDSEVLAPALPGYEGGPPLDGFKAIDDWTFHLADVLADAGHDRVEVLGVSLGGWLAVELALRHPQLVERLALVAPLGLHVPNAPVEPFFGAVAPRGFGGFGEARRLLFADPDGAPAQRALPDDMARDQQLRWFTGLAGAARLGWRAPHFQSRLLARHVHRVACPTTFVFGSVDRLVPHAHADSWQRALPHATVSTIDGAGHAVHAEEPLAVAGALRPADGR